MSFFRTFEHLLPRARAWALRAGKQITSFFEGLSGAPQDAREFLDSVYTEIHPDTTTSLAKWEDQFGVRTGRLDSSRRARLRAAWRTLGGQSPRYLQDAMQAAGFNVFIHEWWEPGTDPRVLRNPLDHATQPLIGTTQCGEDLAECGEADAVCNAFLANVTNYIVNLDLTRNAPPAIPEDDQDAWHYFLYWGGETFGEFADVPEARRAEFEEMLLQLNPAQQWLVTLINYVPTPESLTDLRLWLKHDTGVEVDGGGGIDAVRDQSGNDLDASPIATKPTVDPYTGEILFASGAQFRIDHDSLLHNSDGFVVWALFRGAPSNQALIGKNDNLFQFEWALFNGGFAIQTEGLSTVNAAGTQGGDGLHVARGRWVAGDVHYSLDDEADATAAAATALQDTKIITINGFANGAGTAPWRLSELIVANTDEQEQIDKVQQYLETRQAELQALLDAVILDHTGATINDHNDQPIEV